ncbi:hypothetical protein INR49_013673, partial [Caranx melampygus]
MGYVFPPEQQIRHRDRREHVCRCLNDLQTCYSRSSIMKDFMMALEENAQASSFLRAQYKGIQACPKTKPYWDHVGACNRSHDGGGGRLRSTRAVHKTLGDVITIDLAQRRAQRVDAGAVLARPVRQECTDGMLFLAKGRDPLLLVPQEARQVAPVAVVHVVAVVSFVAPEQQLLHSLSGVKRKEQARLFIHDNERHDANHNGCQDGAVDGNEFVVETLIEPFLGIPAGGGAAALCGALRWKVFIHSGQKLPGVVILPGYLSLLVPLGRCMVCVDAEE